MSDVAAIRIAIVMMMLVMVMMIIMHSIHPRQRRKRSSRLSGTRQSHIQRPLHLLFVVIAENLPLRV